MEYTKEEEVILASTTLVSNVYSVDYKGQIADKQKTGGWKAAPYIVVNEVAERLAFFSIAVNMVAYLVGEMHESLPDAATHVTNWSGAAYLLSLLGAFVSDAYLGRFSTIITFSCIYALGMVLLTISGSMDSLRPPHCTNKPCIEASTAQTGYLYFALALVAVGTGGIKPCVSAFGADQFDESDPYEARKKNSFFNWFFFAINMGVILAITVLVYVRVEFGWAWGFGIPTLCMIVSIIIMAAGFMKYRYEKPVGSAFTRFIQVIVASSRNHLKGVGVVRDGCNLYEVDTKESDIPGARKLPHTKQYRYLDKAAVIIEPAEEKIKNRWKICTITQVEELKSFLRIIPIWFSTVALSISFAQLPTFFVAQANTMNRQLGPDFEIPAGSIAVFSSINALILIPLYEKLAVPFLRSRTGHPRGITSLQRIGVGHFVLIFAMVAAAVVEGVRRRGSSGDSTVSVFWLFPQCFLIGTAEVFTYVGQLEFFYNEATDGTRSISSAVFFSKTGIGSWLSSAVVKVVESGSGGVKKGWLRDDLGSSRLDYFYWILVGINVLNFSVYVFVARRYKCGTNELVVADSGAGGVVDDCHEVVNGEENI